MHNEKIENGLTDLEWIMKDVDYHLKFMCKNIEKWRKINPWEKAVNDDMREIMRATNEGWEYFGQAMSIFDNIKGSIKKIREEIK